MNDWFRSWHGAPTDPKWLLIGKKAGVAPGMVSAIVWALFDHASQLADRGNVSGFDVETYAIFSGFSEEDIAAVIRELTAKGIIEGGRLSAWEKRQPKREDGSAERSREYRERNRTQPNANERKRPDATANEHREDKIREEENREEKKDAEPSGPALSIVPPSTPEMRKTDLYRRGKEILGASGSGLITNLLKAKGGSVELARAALEQSAASADARSYIGAIIRGRNAPSDKAASDRERGYAW